MRRFLILLMVVLLPLRGWAGDLMGIQMAVVDTSMSAESSMPPDCPMHLQAGTSSVDVGEVQMPSDMEKCASCQLCIALAAVSELPLELATRGIHAQPLMPGVDFDSASPDLAFKPPIS